MSRQGSSPCGQTSQVPPYGERFTGSILCFTCRFRRGASAGKEPELPRVRDVPAILFTFAAVSLTWIFFRASTFTEAWDYLSGIATLRPGEVSRTAVWIIMPALAVATVIDIAQRRSHTHDAVLHWPPVPRGIAYVAALVAFIVFSGQAPVPFIYFQF